VRLVDEQNQVRPFLDLANDVLNTVLEHATQHRAGDHRVHLQVDHLAVAQADRHRVRVEFDAAREAFDDGGLSHAGFANQHHRVRPLAVAENLEHLLDFRIAAVDRRNPVLARQQVQIRREVLQERRQFESFPKPLFTELVVAHSRCDPGDQHLGLDAVMLDDGHGHALTLLEDRRKEVG